jgi:hypothetical protein
VSAPGVPEAWPEPVERVSAYLRAAGVEARLEEFEEGTLPRKLFQVTLMKK